MSQSLTINGKKYVQSSVLTAQYQYTPDYIGKLAREEKIIGTQVGRQWYIEPESLKVFLHKASLEKEIRAEELSRKRKIEHQAFQKKQNISVENVSSPHLALAQMFAIVGCGTIAGILGFNAWSSDITMGDVTQSVKESGVFIARSFSPIDAISKMTSAPKSFLASSPDATSVIPQKFEQQQGETFTSLPQQEGAALYSDSVIKQQFSDEVTITEDSEGRMYVQPVFKDTTDKNTLFKVVPIE